MAKISDFADKNDSDQTEKQIRETFDRYKDMDRSQLSEQLFNEVARQKRCGTFDFQALSNMVEGLKGYLPEDDYQNIKRILQSLK